MKSFVLTPLRFQRLLKNLKVIDLARRSGISATLLSRIERGQIPASQRVRQRLSRALCLPEQMLFGDR